MAKKGKGRGRGAGKPSGTTKKDPAYLKWQTKQKLKAEEKLQSKTAELQQLNTAHVVGAALAAQAGGSPTSRKRNARRLSKNALKLVNVKDKKRKKKKKKKHA